MLLVTVTHINGEELETPKLRFIRPEMLLAPVEPTVEEGTEEEVLGSPAKLLVSYNLFEGYAPQTWIVSTTFGDVVYGLATTYGNYGFDNDSKRASFGILQCSGGFTAGVTGTITCVGIKEGATILPVPPSDPDESSAAAFGFTYSINEEAGTFVATAINVGGTTETGYAAKGVSFFVFNP